MELFLSIMAALVVLRYSFKFFFDDLQDFADCLKLLMTPDIVALFRGDWDRQNWASLKIIVWLVFAGSAGYGAYQFLQS